MKKLLEFLGLDFSLTQRRYFRKKIGGKWWQMEHNFLSPIPGRIYWTDQEPTENDLRKSSVLQTEDWSPKRILFCDAESASLRGEIFAVALIGDDNTILFNGYYPHEELTKEDSWVAQNVKLSGKKFPDRKSFLVAFLVAFEGCREKYGFGKYKSLTVCGHMPAPVEANLFQQLYKEAGMTEFAGPYHLLSSDTLLWTKGETADSEKYYAKRHKLEMPYGYTEHSALSDVQLTRIVWEHMNRPRRLVRLMNWIKHLFTGHNKKNSTFICNIWGDAIMQTSKHMRSVWQCKDCGGSFYQKDLHKHGENI